MLTSNFTANYTNFTHKIISSEFLRQSKHELILRFFVVAVGTDFRSGAPFNCLATRVLTISDGGRFVSNQGMDLSL
jgi:hypothetical protein